MNQEIKQKWVEALRSGKYAQVQGALYHHFEGKDCFCALGVLSDIIAPDLWDRDIGFNYLYSKVSYGPTGLFLAKNVVDAAQLAHGDEARIYEMNDERHATFKQIADYIEHSL